MSLRKFEPWVLGIALLLPTAVTLAYFVLASGTTEIVQQAVYAVGKVIQFALPIVWVVFLLRQRPRFRWGDGVSLLLGGAFGLAIMLITWFGYEWLAATDLLKQAIQPVAAKVQEIGIGSPGKFLAVGLFYAVLHSLLEEYYWRWFVYGRLRGVLRETAALVVSSAGFALHHVVLLAAYFAHSPLAVAGLSGCVFVGGLFWAWLYRRSGSLLGPWLGHLLVDAGIFAVGYHMVFSQPAASG